jgi:hypothetical protein
MKLLSITLLLCCLLSGQGNPPSWNYSPWYTKGVFEGLDFGFARPTTNTADITVTALVEGKEICVSHKVNTAPRTGPDGSPANGLFPMKIGNLDTFKVLRVELTIGAWTGDEQNPEPAKNYELKENARRRF